MTRVVHLPIGDIDGLIVLDRERRLYAALSRDGSYYHLIRPARSTDLRVVEGRAQVGDLMCDCIGSSTHGRCYQQMNAMALEAADVAGLQRPDWAEPRDEIGIATFDAPVGAGEAVEASRG